MDPNAALRMIEEALTDLRILDANNVVKGLEDWIASGGFEPNWNAYPRAAAYYLFLHTME